MKSIRILFVDDDPLILETLTQAFELMGFTTFQESSGNKAMSFLESNVVDVVISDVRMPDGGGIDLLKSIKLKSPMTPKVFFVSGFTDSTLEELFALGADGFFMKPFLAQEISKCIRESVNSNNERWADKNFSAQMELRRSFPDIHQAMKSGELSFGRGGFFVKHNEPVNSENLSFNFEIADNEPCEKLSGVGRIQWVRKKEENSRPPGLGIEILHLEDHCRVLFCEWMKKYKIPAYIPRR